MQLVIDILLIAVFAIMVFRGWWKGFMKSVLGLGRMVLSIIIVIAFGSPFSAWIDGKFVNPPVFNAVFKKFSEIGDEISATANGSVDALAEKIPDIFRGHLDLSNLDPTAEIDALVEQWSHTVADSLSKIIATVIGYVLLFIIAFVVLTIVIFIVDKVAKLPLLKTADKILGLVLGAVSGILAVMVVSVILGALLGALGQGDVVENSFMLKLFSGLRGLLFK